jgi:3',5'-cyclic AMP phosphodiesterase CpdA
MRFLLTADLHFNHRRSRPLAEEVIERINRERFDVLVVVGDTAPTEGTALEECLARFTFTGSKLFVPGNHELWTKGQDSYAIFNDELPRRVRDAGWEWLPGAPFVAGDVAIVGMLGWYDYSFAQAELRIPRRFYAAKLSPGAAKYNEVNELFQETADIPPESLEMYARWNDGKFVKLPMSDEKFLDEQLARLEEQLESVRGRSRVIAAVHHLPFAELLPPQRIPQWDFAKAYLGSGRIGEMLLRYENVRDVYCGHSHFPARATVGRIRAVNIGSGYRWKTFETLEI